MIADPRTTPSNGRIAHASLKGAVEADRYTEGQWMMVAQPITHMTDAPNGARISQLMFGERFLVLDSINGFAFGQAERDGYVGYLPSSILSQAEAPTHWVMAPATHLYPRAEFKSAPDVSLFFASQVRVTDQEGEFRRIHTGHFIPAQHLMPISARFSDPVGIADLFLGTPYLWGGCSRWGIDCSGLVQSCLIACGQPCPRDSDQQEEIMGEMIPDDAPLKRGDLIFWDGHVGMMSSDTMLLHANAHHMAVAYEPLEDAVARIGAKEFGQVTSRKRVALS
ncbi:NlpC/P60 family protein [Gymnodinialimonas sp. 2305UL16-5]|uniref:C40 family peptidase n=1 Tax=Gymnodinialimonas mytili TaxID=3126503 RepID=UPI0030B5E646